MLNIGNRNAINSQRGGLTGFSIDHSFLLDGVNEFFTIPKAQLSSVLSGANKTITYGGSFMLNGGLGTQQMVFAVDNLSSTYVFVTTGNNIQLRQLDSGTKNLTATGTTLTTATWYNYLITYDYSQSLGSRGKMYINDVELTITLDTLTTNIDAPTADYKIGERSNVNNLSANILQMFVLDVIPTTAQRTAWYNGGKPNSPKNIWGANCKWFGNPDESGSTAQFVMTDAENSVTATSSNMEDADKTTVTPY